MAVLDLTTVQACSASVLEDTVLSSSGTGSYAVRVSLDETLDRCTCPGWQFHRRCRHVTETRAKLCGWSAEDGPAQTLQQEVDMVCPRCGSDTNVVRWGV